MDALFLSFRLALCVSAILLVIGIPVAYWLAFSSWRGKFLLESVVALPLVLPPTVLGFYALVAMGPRGPLGKLWIALFGHGLAFTFAGLVLASVLYSFPFAVQPLIASFEGVDQKLLDASAVLGAGRLRTFRRVILPLALPGVVTALVLSFAHTLGEFGVVLMVGGNLAGVTRTVSIDIYDHVQSLEYGQANHMALVLLLRSFAVLSVVSAANRRPFLLCPGCFHRSFSRHHHSLWTFGRRQIHAARLSCRAGAAGRRTDRSRWRSFVRFFRRNRYPGAEAAHRLRFSDARLVSAPER